MPEHNVTKIPNWIMPSLLGVFTVLAMSYSVTQAKEEAAKLDEANSAKVDKRLTRNELVIKSNTERQITLISKVDSMSDKVDATALNAQENKERLIRMESQQNLILQTLQRIE